MSKNKNVAGKPLSPAKYIITKARTLPIYKCFINDNWEKAKKAIVIVTRKHSTGHLTSGVYEIDFLSKGLIDTFYVFNLPENEAMQKFTVVDNGLAMIEVNYSLAHNIIYSAIEYAEENDIKSHKDFAVTRNIIEEDDENIEFIDIVFGSPENSKNENDLESDKAENKDERSFETYSDKDWEQFFSSDQSLSQSRFRHLYEVFFKKWLKSEYDIQELESHYIDFKDLNMTFGETDSPYNKFFQTEEALLLTRELKNPESTPDKILEMAKSAMEKDPENPSLPLLVALCYIETGQKDNYQELSKNIINQHADFYPAILMNAEFFLSEGKIDQAWESLGKAENLKKLLPGRIKFSSEELARFHHVLLQIFILKREYLKAWIHLKLLLGISIDDKLKDSLLPGKFMFIKTMEEKAKLYIAKLGYDISRINLTSV